MERSSAPARCGLRNRSGPTWRQWCRSWGIGRSRRIGSFGRVRKPGLSAENHHDSAGPRFLEFFGSKGASSCNEGTASGIALMGSSSAPARRGLRNRSGPTWRQWCRSWGIGRSRCVWAPGAGGERRGLWAENHHDSAGGPGFWNFSEVFKSKGASSCNEGTASGIASMGNSSAPARHGLRNRSAWPAEQVRAHMEAVVPELGYWKK